jgi:hypothetical protein
VTPSDSAYGISRSALEKDSLVVIPKTIALWLAQDAYRARSYEHEIELLNEVVNLRDGVILKQVEMIDSYKLKVSSCQELNRSNDLVISGLRKQVRKETTSKRFWKTVAVVAPILVGTLMYTRQ